ncbi:hypothetical protein QTI17_29540 [Variovorax sp. J31P179]|uniref:DUF6998 domain-containing protein n=1 Tax=Variovorax sp. J31P179 TaxID=3053508 RepID=UPI0025789BCA|nr:hypothetical protein [Variovorax sp. J31P179]MDM0084751.1 hypothetical protein [Variovorax sp. J31P179]
MAMSQMQLIQSLGEAMSWFEREISWGVAPTELRHLCGRIGELYVAMITNGQMATEVNQRGYDVVSAINERISVKTTAQSGLDGFISFNPNTLDQVDRVFVLRINTEEMQVETLLDKPIADARQLMNEDRGSGRLNIPLRRLAPNRSAPRETSPLASEATLDGFLVRELESGTIEVLRDGQPQVPAKPVLRELAIRLNVGLLNQRGNPLNTRQLGTLIIRSIKEIGAPERQDAEAADASRGPR